MRLMRRLIPYVAAVAAVGITTVLIGLVLGFGQIANISMLYLVAVLVIAVGFGRAAAIVAVPPLLTYIERVGANRDRPLTIVVSQFVPRHWWEFFLHSQTAFRLKLALLFRPDTIVIDVPYHPRTS